MHIASLWLLALGVATLPACVDDVPLPAGGDNIDPLSIPEHCVPGQDAPRTLDCTGLYSNLLAKEVAPPVRPFTPAVHLWSDGAEKQRWIYLPPGTTIDNGQPTSWSFPVGTRVWKEFKHAGQRIETRFFQKTDADRWVTATYLWRDGDTAADSFGGGDVPVPDGTYHVPTQEECDQCHRGRKDRLLGFEGTLLGLPGAEGVTLAVLAAEGRLIVAPGRTNVQIPDDGTGLAAPALGWLHVNCGVSCHNDYQNSNAYLSRLYLRIDPARLEDTSSAGWNMITSTVSTSAVTPNFGGALRIIPGAPDNSLIAQLASTRGSSRAMPPIASRTVDMDGLQALRRWIAAMAPHVGGADGGVLAEGGAANIDAGAPQDPGDAAVDAESAEVDSGNLGVLEAGSPDTDIDAGPLAGDAGALAADPDAAPASGEAQAIEARPM